MSSLSRIFGRFNRLGCILAKSVTRGVAWAKYILLEIAKRSGVLNILEIKDAKRRILMLFEAMFWKLVLLRKLKINKLPNGAFCLSLKRCLMRRYFILIEFSGPMSFSRDFIVSYTILY